MQMNVTVLGAGSWGTTVAHLAAHNAPTVLWGRDGEVAKAINDRHENPRYLPGRELHADLSATDDLADAVGRADLLVVGVPSGGFRQALAAAEPHLRPWVPVISLTKGLERGTALRMSEVIEQELPGRPTGVLTGPNLAKEIMDGHASASVVAMSDHHVAERLQSLFATPGFRVYTNDDVVGSELGGALKNVVALAAGIADGLGSGDNTRAAVITRGLREMTRLGVAMGGRAETFSGLAGMGDLVATCISEQSRNRHFGQRLGEGATMEDIVAEMDQVAEGAKSAPVVVGLAREYRMHMPIAETVLNVCSGAMTALEAYAALLEVPAGAEFDEPS